MQRPERAGRRTSMRPACVLVRERGVGNVGRKAGTTFDVGWRDRNEGTTVGRQHSRGLGPFDLSDVAGLRNRTRAASGAGWIGPVASGRAGGALSRHAGAPSLGTAPERNGGSLDRHALRAGNAGGDAAQSGARRRDVPLALAGARPRGALRQDHFLHDGRESLAQPRGNDSAASHAQGNGTRRERLARHARLHPASGQLSLPPQGDAHGRRRVSAASSRNGSKAA